MKGFPSREQVERLRQQYPKGTKICCDYMSDDPRPIPPGTIGEVVGVDDAGQVMTRWSNGSSLSVIPGVDSFHVVQPAVSEAKKELTEKHSSRYGDVYVSTCYDNSIPRVDDNGNEILCEGYYCQVFSDSDCTNEIDSFCLAEGVEITDLSDEAVAAGIKSYLGLNNEDIAQDEDESQGMSIDL